MEVFTSTMNNFQTAINATETALNSQGSATRENERYMESLEAKLQALQSAWEKFSYTLMNTKFLSGSLTVLTQFLNFLSTDLGNAIIHASGAFGIFAGSVAVFNKITGKSVQATAVLKGGIQGLFGLLRAHPIGIVITALAGMGIAIKNIYSDTHQYTKSVKDLVDANKEQIISIDLQGSKHKALVGTLDELMSKEVKSVSDKEKIKAIVDELNASYDGLNLEYNEENDSLNKNISAINSVIEAKLRLLRTNAIVSAMEGTAEKSLKLEIQKKELLSDQEDLQRRLNEMPLDSPARAQLEQEMGRIEQKIKDTDKAMEALEEENARLNAELAVEGMKDVKFDTTNIDAVTEKLKLLGTTFGVSVDSAGNLNKIDLSTFINQMAQAGFSSEFTLSMLKTLGEQNPEMTVTLNNEEYTLGQLESIDYDLSKLQDNPDAPLTVTLDGKETTLYGLGMIKDQASGLENGVRVPVELSPEEEAELNSKLAKVREDLFGLTQNPYLVKTNADTSGANDKLGGLEHHANLVGGLNPHVKADADTGNASRNLAIIANKAVSLGMLNPVITIGMRLASGAAALWRKLTGSGKAKGDKNFKGGVAIVNDQKNPPNGDPTELIQQDGQLFVAEGKDTPVILKKGATIYTAQETQDILSGNVQNLEENPSMLDKMRGSLAYAQSSSLDTPSLTGGANLQPKYIMSDYGGMASSVVSQSDDHSITISNMTVKSENPSDWVRQLRGLVDITN